MSQISTQFSITYWQTYSLPTELFTTETALLQVQKDILTHLDAGKGVILCLLDLSAAFNTIDLTSSLIGFLQKLVYKAQF